MTVRPKSVQPESRSDPIRSPRTGNEADASDTTRKARAQDVHSLHEVPPTHYLQLFSQHEINALRQEPFAPSIQLLNHPQIVAVLSECQEQKSAASCTPSAHAKVAFCLCFNVSHLQSLDEAAKLVLETKLGQQLGPWENAERQTNCCQLNEDAPAK